MLTDYHTHSYRCGHASGKMDDYIRSALRLGIGEIGLSDHLFIYFDETQRKSSKWAIAEADYDTHYEEMCALREQYRDQINVRVAVEADYFGGFEDTLIEILSRYQFDYVLGSVHFLGDWMIDDPDQAGRYSEGSVAEIYRRYFQQLQRAIRLGEFDVLAHFDLPKKFGFRPEEEVNDVILETLDLAREQDLAIEVSTAGLRKPVGEIYPQEWILREMKRREIPIVLSSDAHHPEEVGAEFDHALALIRRVGYRELSTFAGRTRTAVPLSG